MELALYRAVMVPADLIWHFRNLQKRFLVGSALRSLERRRLRFWSFISEMWSFSWSFEVSSNCWSITISWWLWWSMAISFFAWMSEMRSLGSLVPFFFFLTLRPRVFLAEELILSEIWGSISSEDMTVNLVSDMDDRVWSRVSLYLVKSVFSVKSY